MFITFVVLYINFYPLNTGVNIEVVFNILFASSGNYKFSIYISIIYAYDFLRNTLSFINIDNFGYDVLTFYYYYYSSNIFVPYVTSVNVLCKSYFD